MSKITPFLWYNGRVEEAAKFYVAAFKGKAKIITMSREGKRVYSAIIKIAGQEYFLFNGGPAFKFTPAISLFVDCKDQKEVDWLWEKLSKGGKKKNCGWLTDKFGVSWQIIPSILGKLINDRDDEKASRAFQAMMGMTKIDIAALKKAHAGK